MQILISATAWAVAAAVVLLLLLLVRRVLVQAMEALWPSLQSLAVRLAKLVHASPRVWRSLTVLTGAVLMLSAAKAIAMVMVDALYATLVGVHALVMQLLG